MLDQKLVFEKLASLGVDFFTGVPDSYLNVFCDYALEYLRDKNVIAANEGNAAAIAAGHYIASGNIPLVYMQNSGIGSALNPLVSLADRRVYSVPMILLIGWRGQGDSEADHPQHTFQGEITTKLMDDIEIPYSILTDDIDDFNEAAEKAVRYCRSQRRAYALIAPKGVMAGEKKNTSGAEYSMSREEAIELIIDAMPKNAIFFATTGRAARELYFLREKRGEDHSRDFLNIGAMGHVSSFALGVALEKSDRPLVVLDGDGAAIMHLGALATIGTRRLPNLIHIVLNNGAHESVGNQPSAGQSIDFTKIAEACGYASIGKAVTTRDELSDALLKLSGRGEAAFIDCRIHSGISAALPTLDFSPREAIDALIAELDG